MWAAVQAQQPHRCDASNSIELVDAEDTIIQSRERTNQRHVGTAVAMRAAYSATHISGVWNDKTAACSRKRPLSNQSIELGAGEVVDSALRCTSEKIRPFRRSIVERHMHPDARLLRGKMALLELGPNLPDLRQVHGSA